jgi:hypothetical protein
MIDVLGTPPTAAGAPIDASLVASGLDRVLIEMGIVPGVSLTDDAGNQLTSINGRQMLALIGAAVVGKLIGAGTLEVFVKAAGNPAGSTRIDMVVDSAKNRLAATLKVPT